MERGLACEAEEKHVVYSVKVEFAENKMRAVAGHTFAREVCSALVIRVGGGVDVMAAFAAVTDAFSAP